MKPFRQNATYQTAKMNLLDDYQQTNVAQISLKKRRSNPSQKLEKIEKSMYIALKKEK